VPRSPDEEPLSVVEATFDDVRKLAALFREAAEAAGLQERVQLDCELALVEAANNIVEHGYAGTTGGKISFWLAIVPAEVRMELRDQGKPVPSGQFSKCQQFELDAPDGRGTTIIQSCIDQIGYRTEHGENRLVMIKQL